MAPIIKDQPVYLVGPPEKTEDIVKFAGVEFATFHRYEPTYLAFQSSFYLSKFSGKIVQYTSDMSKKGFYIVSENAVDRRKEKVYYRFRNRADIWFLLIKKD